jgi:transposase
MSGGCASSALLITPNPTRNPRSFLAHPVPVQGGVEGLRHRPPPGATARLSSAQRDQLLELLARGAESLGFQGEVWTQPRVAALIRDRFGVSYHPSQVGCILQACGWSWQKPVQRATQRDERVIRQWREERWPQIKKRP